MLDRFSQLSQLPKSEVLPRLLQNLSARPALVVLRYSHQLVTPGTVTEVIKTGTPLTIYLNMLNYLRCSYYSWAATVIIIQTENRRSCAFRRPQALSKAVYIGWSSSAPAIDALVILSKLTR